jgi:aminoglycoside/choline kinase family phosphotransferase
MVLTSTNIDFNNSKILSEVIPYFEKKSSKISFKQVFKNNNSYALYQVFDKMECIAFVKYYPNLSGFLKCKNELSCIFEARQVTPTLVPQVLAYRLDLDPPYAILENLSGVPYTQVTSKKRLISIQSSGKWLRKFHDMSIKSMKIGENSLFIIRKQADEALRDIEHQRIVSKEICRTVSNLANGIILIDGESTSLIHGDYQMGNLLFNSSSGEISGIVDFEYGFRGNPYIDLAAILSKHNKDNFITSNFLRSYFSPQEIKNRELWIPIVLLGQIRLICNQIIWANNNMLYPNYLKIYLSMLTEIADSKMPIGCAINT